MTQITLRRLHGGDLRPEPLADVFDIVIGGAASSPTVLHISIRDGWLEIRSGDGLLDVQPVAANCLRVRPGNGLGAPDAKLSALILAERELRAIGRTPEVLGAVQAAIKNSR